LVLREPTVADAADVLVFRGDPLVQRFNDEPLRDTTEAEAFIRFLLAESAADTRRHWAITIDGAVVGLEAGRAVIEFGFTQMGLHRIQAHTIADNIRSVRLLQRLGFRHEGTLREYSLEDDGTFHHSAVYGLLHTDHR
jgi:RimJ/RimL family protein N-acetyltransferase